MRDLTHGAVRILVIGSSPSQDIDLANLLCQTFHARVEAQSMPSMYAALDFLDHYGADMVITDARLADGSGLDLCRQMKTRSELAHIPVMIILDHQGRDEHMAAVQSGADDIITRPIQDRLLLARVELLWRTRGAGGILRVG